jgi:hypothetical protein
MAGEEDCWPLEVLRCPPSPSRNPLQDARRSSRIFDDGFIHIGIDVSWRNAVDRDALARPSITHRLCHLRYAAFAGRVRRHIDTALKGEETCHVYDVAAPAVGIWLAREHLCTDLAAENERGV